MFKYSRIDDEFIIENNEFRIVLKEPSIQPFNSYTLISDDNGIMYYYYTIELCRNKNIYGKKPNWTLIKEGMTHDMPSIQDFENMLEYFKTLDPKIDGQKIKYRNGSVAYRETHDTKGFFNEDLYEITKTERELDENKTTVYYDIYIGFAVDPQGGLNTVGVKLEYLKEEEIDEFQKWVKEFIEYSIERENKYIQEMIDFESSNKKVVNGRLFVYDDEGKLDEIIAVGDKVDLFVMNETNEDEYINVEVTNISTESLTISRGQCFDIKKIGNIFYQPSQEMIEFKIDDCVEYLKEFMRDDLYMNNLEEFRESIINRFWMFREEHGFIREQKGDRRKQVDEVVDEIIKQLKN